MRMDAAASAR